MELLSSAIITVLIFLVMLGLDNLDSSSVRCCCKARYLCRKKKRSQQQQESRDPTDDCDSTTSVAAEMMMVGSTPAPNVDESESPTTDKQVSASEECPGGPKVDRES